MRNDFDSDRMPLTDIEHENNPDNPKPSIYESLAISYMDYEDVERLHTEGTINDHDVSRYMAEYEIRDDFLNMSPDNFLYAADNNMLNDRQIDMYLEHTDRPVWFQTKNLLLGIPHGLASMVNEVEEALEPFINPGGMVARGLLGIEKQAAVPEEWIEAVAPDTIGGKVMSLIAQFGTPFVGEVKLFAKMTKGTKIAKSIMKSKSFAPLVKKAPKFAGFVAQVIEHSALGATTDYAAFDPFDPGITEFLDEVGILPEFMTFMASDVDDPVAWARLKRAAEGAFVGNVFGFTGSLVAKYVMKSFELVKKMANVKHFGEADKIAKDGLKVKIINTKESPDLRTNIEREIDDLESKRLVRETEGDPDVVAKEGTTLPSESDISRLNEDQEMWRKLKKRYTDLGNLKQAKAYGKKLDEVEAEMLRIGYKVDPKSGKPKFDPEDMAVKVDPEDVGKYEAKMLHPRSSGTARLAADTLQFIKKDIDGNLDFNPDFNMSKMNTFPEVAEMIKYQIRQGVKAVKKVKGEVQTEAVLERQTMRIFKEFSKMPPAAVIQMAEEKFGMTGLHQAGQFLNALADYTVTLDKKIIDLVKTGTDQADMLKAQYLIEMAGQALRYLETASTDGGRLLNSMKRVKSVRKNLLNLTRDDISEIGDLAGQEQLIKLYARIKDPFVRMQVARQVSNGKIQKGILEFVQATLVWGMNTTRVNIVGNVMAMSMKAFTQLVGVSADAALKLDWGRLSGEVNAYKAGLKEAWEDCFRLATGERMGKVWKVAKTGEAQLDASVKFEGQNIHVLHEAGAWLHEKVGLNPKFNIGDAYSASFRNLGMQDELFKNLSYYSQKHTAIFREAYKRHGKGQKTLREGLIHEMEKDLPPSIHREAWENARRNTYTMAPSKLTRSLMSVTTAGFKTKFGVHQPFYFLRIVGAPFVNIADNLMRFAGRHTVANVLSTEFGKLWKAGGAERWEALARIMSGTSLIGLGYTLHDQGLMTAMIPVGDKGKSLYQNWKSRSVTPYSLTSEFDSRLTSIIKFAPVALLVTLGANISQMFETFGMSEELRIDLDDMILKVMLPAIVDPIVNQHYLKSIKDISDLVFNPERTNVKKALLNQVPKFMPLDMLIKQAREDLLSVGWDEERADAFVTETNTLRDAMKKSYGSDALIVMRHHIFGTKIPKMTDKDWWAVVPGATQRKTDAWTPGTVEHEFGQIGFNMGEMSTTLALGKPLEPIELTPEQFDAIEEIIEGMDVKGQLEKRINSEKYQNIPVDTRVGKVLRLEILETIVKDIRAAARMKFIKNNKNIVEEHQRIYREEYEIFKQGRKLLQSRPMELTEGQEELKEFINGK